MSTKTKSKLGDERLTRGTGAAVRGDRDAADQSRTQDDGGALSAAERRRMLRQDWVQEILPTAPKIPGFHTCWLSTTNSTDPVYKRIQRGYTPVKMSETGNFGAQFLVQEGEFAGCVMCNEMLLFKVPDEVYQDLMTIFHHDMPLEQEQSVYEKAQSMQEQDSSGRNLGSVEGDFNRLGRSPGIPVFN
jgi:hypothetical protein